MPSSDIPTFEMPPLSAEEAVAVSAALWCGLHRALVALAENGHAGRIISIRDGAISDFILAQGGGVSDQRIALAKSAGLTALRKAFATTGNALKAHGLA